MHGWEKKEKIEKGLHSRNLGKKLSAQRISNSLLFTWLMVVYAQHRLVCHVRGTIILSPKEFHISYVAKDLLK